MLLQRNCFVETELFEAIIHRPSVGLPGRLLSEAAESVCGE